jgi:hypothetical protein
MNNSVEEHIATRVELLKKLGRTNRALRRAGVPLVARIETASALTNDDLLDVVKKSERRLGWQHDA